MDSNKTWLYRGQILIFFLGFFLFLGISQAAEESESSPELSFMQQLHLQEEEEYQALINSIKTMSRAEYASLMNDRVDKAFDNSSAALPAMVIVDVTTESNQVQPGFFQRLFSLSPSISEDDYGITKLRGILNTSASDTSGNNPAIATQAVEITLKDKYQSVDSQKHFQRLESTLSKQEAKTLIASNDIVDLHVIKSSSESFSSFVTTHLPTGRVLPRKSTKEYDPEFLHAGLYDELMNKFETSNKLMVEVNFQRPEDADEVPSEETRILRKNNVDNFINDWSDYEFDVFHKAEFYAVLKTTKQHVEAMKLDERVDFIRAGSAAFIPIAQP